MQHVPAGVAIGPGGDVYLSGTAFIFGGGDRGPQIRAFPYPFLVRYSGDLTSQSGGYEWLGGTGGAIAIHPVTGEVYALSI
jgi:hypothetical protein